MLLYLDDSSDEQEKVWESEVEQSEWESERDIKTIKRLKSKYEKLMAIKEIILHEICN